MFGAFVVINSDPIAIKLGNAVMQPQLWIALVVVLIPSSDSAR